MNLVLYVQTRHGLAVNHSNIVTTSELICWFNHIAQHESIWASTPKTLSSGVCEQQKHRPDCTLAQSGQHLCYSQSGKYSSQP